MKMILLSVFALCCSRNVMRDAPGLDFIFMDSINVHCGIFSMLCAEIYLKAGNGHS